MPHDQFDKQLAVGDEVLVLATVTELHATEDYCNVTLETVYGRRPDGQKEMIHAINTAVVALCPKVGDSVVIGEDGKSGVVATAEPPA